MYKLDSVTGELIHTGTCCICGETRRVFTVGSNSTKNLDRDYCNECVSDRIRLYTFDYMVKKVSEYFQNMISSSDLVYYEDADRVLLKLADLAVTEESFCTQVNKYIVNHRYTLSTKFRNLVYLTLSRKYKLSFFIMSPDKFNVYLRLLKEIKNITQIDYSKGLSLNEYYSSVSALNTAILSLEDK